MQGTFALMKLLADPEVQKVSERERIAEYKRSQDPRILAGFFVDWYNQILAVGKKYYAVAGPDLASLALERLDFCLVTFDEQCGDSLRPYYLTCLYNAARTASIEVSQVQKRKANIGAVPFHLLEDVLLDSNPSWDLAIDVQAAVQQLPSRVRQYVGLVAEGATSADVCAEMGVSRMALSNWRRAVRNHPDFAGLLLT